MKVNPQIKQLLGEISQQATKLSNNPPSDYRYMRRLLRSAAKHLSEEEKVYILIATMEMLHYKSVVVDPDNLLVLSNIRMRTYLFIFILTITVLFTAAILFKTNDALNGIVEWFIKLLTIFSF